MKSILSKLVPQSLKNLYHWMQSLIANMVYGFPSRRLKIIGVTGTDGKTTTSTMLYHLLQKDGKKVGLVSTVSAKIGKDELPTGLHVTTPDPFLLQKILKQMVNVGMEYVVLEITSHGLDQFRVSGVQLIGGIYTNVTPEHLDYHKTYKKYIKAKSKLMNLIDEGFVVLNRDDESYEYLRNKAGRKELKILTYGKGKKVDLGFDKYKSNADSSTFNILRSKSKISGKIPLPGDFNVYNFLGALSAAKELGFDIEKARSAMDDFGGVKGRWTIIQDKPFKVIVDFAHTPNALKEVLESARDITSKKLISVFGCAGLRDPSKRDQMGKIAGDIADITIATAEDPRVESLKEINNLIEKGWRSADIKGKEFYRFDDISKNVKVRRDAIKKALKLAKPGDTVIITGKGHEESLCFGKKEYPWSDIDEVKKLLK